MKSWTKVICTVAVIAVTSPYAFAQQTQVATPSSVNPGSPGLTPQQMQEMYNDYYSRSGLGYGGNRNADGSVTTLAAPGAQLFQQEEKKVYRYDGKDRLLYGVEMPRRSFNNIPYPY